MSKIATTHDTTVWRCDECYQMVESENAFTLPPGWWVAVIERRTEGGKMKKGSIDACSKDCLTSAIRYNNQSLVDYVEAR